GSRYVPAEADRRVRARSDDCCIVSMCGQAMWVQRSHRTPHRLGGSREATNLDLLCDYHHFLYETGSMYIAGPADAPVFTDRYGTALSERTAYDWGLRQPAGRGAASESAEAAGRAAASGPAPPPGPVGAAARAPKPPDPPDP